MATIKDVAELAGVSIATVSRVLNNTGRVSDARRIQVENAVKALDFNFNMAGKILRKAKTNSILLVFSVLIPEFLKGVIDEANRQHYNVIMSYTPVYIQNAKPLQPLYQGLVDGVILQDVMLEKSVLKNTIENYPVVCCGNFMDFAEVKPHGISINNQEVSYQVTRYLLEKGKKTIGCVGLFIDNAVEPLFSIEREKGVQQALIEAGIPLNTDLKYKGDVGYQTGRDAVDYYQTLDEMPDAVFCFNDKIAIGCIARLRELNIRVPEDIYVVGFDNLGITAQFSPTITTVAQPFEEMGELSVRGLMQQLEGSEADDGALNQKIEAMIIFRESTGEA